MRSTVLLLATCLAATAQEFDSAWIRRAVNAPASEMGRSPGTTVSIRNAPLRKLLTDSFDISDSQLSGPAWLATERFDLEAKAPKTGAGRITEEEMHAMLRNLLTGRFGIALHHADQNMPVYVLTDGKAGARRPVVMGQNGHARVVCPGCSLPRLLTLLRAELGRPVENQSSIEGRFDLTIRSHESVEQDLKNQLGLELKQKKTAVDTIVIDHIERTPKVP